MLAFLTLCLRTKVVRTQWAQRRRNDGEKRVENANRINVEISTSIRDVKTTLFRQTVITSHHDVE